MAKEIDAIGFVDAVEAAQELQEPYTGSYQEGGDIGVNTGAARGPQGRFMEGEDIGKGHQWSEAELDRESKSFLERIRAAYVAEHGELDNEELSECLIDFLAEIDPAAKDYWNTETAVHEGGHAAAAMQIGLMVRGAAIDKGYPRTRVTFDGSAEKIAIVYLAGEQAEAHHSGRAPDYGEHSGACEDFAEAVAAARACKPADVTLEAWLGQLADRAKQLVTSAQGAAMVNSIARRLLRHGALDGQAIQKIARRVMVKKLTKRRAPVRVKQVEQVPPQVTVNAPITLHVPPQEPTQVTVRVPQQPAPQVTVQPAQVTVDAPITVNVPPSQPRKIRLVRDEDGEVAQIVPEGA